MPLTIAEWATDHPQWGEVQQLITALGQDKWMAFHADWHLSAHMLVACVEAQVVGYLRYIVQPLGAEEKRPPVMLKEERLTEGKVIAFGVAAAHRRQGIGRALQQALIERCRAQGCYQVRSYSSGSNEANHQLKLSLGFAMHPVIRGPDELGAYFVLGLRETDR